MNPCKIVFGLSLLLLSIKGVGQADINYTADTAQVNKLLQESKGFFTSDPDKAIDLCMQAKRIAEKAGFRQGEAYALKNIGITNYLLSKYVDALQYYNSSLELFRSLHDNGGIANLLSNIGVIYYYRGNSTKALENYLESLKYAELANDKARISVVLNNIGNVYDTRAQDIENEIVSDSTGTTNNNKISENYEKALAYYLKALPICKELNDEVTLGAIFVNVGTIYYKQKKNDKALTYFNNALEAYKNSGGAVQAYKAISKLYLEEKKYDLALTNNDKALKIAEKDEVKLSLMQTLTVRGNIYKSMGKYDEALFHFRRAEKLGIESQANAELKDLYKGMAETFDSVGDYRSAYSYQVLFSEKSALVYNQDQDKKVAAMQFDRDMQKKQDEIKLQDLQIKKQKAFKNALIVGLGMVLFIIIVLFRDYRIKIRTNKILDKQKVEIENLLLNILPQEVAHELQSTGKSTPRNYESVSVLFTDFKSFTAHAEKMSPDEVVQELNTCFMAFDEIIGKYNLEKIKTIGDAYMCAGGIPTPEEGHVFRMVQASLEIQEFIFRNNERRKSENLPPWEIRIGINVGPVVAGVVGKKKYAYDIWGSAVNIASRMESNGMPGQINISSSVYEVIKEKYACIYRGKIYAKNVGDIDMYFIDHEIESFDGFKAFEEAEPREATVVEPTSTTDLLQ